MPITLRRPDLDQTLERAYVLAIGEQPLPETWLERSGQLSASPSVGFIAAVGAVLLAKATDARIDAFVIQVKEGSAGAFNLRAAATALAANRRTLGYDIGSSSDRDPINHGPLVSSPRWDVALDRIREDHQPFFQLILRWLHDVNRMDERVRKLQAHFHQANQDIGDILVSSGKVVRRGERIEAMDFDEREPQLRLAGE